MPTPRFPRDGGKWKAPTQGSGIVFRIGIGALLAPLEGGVLVGSSEPLGSVPVVEAAGDESTVCLETSTPRERGKATSPAVVGGPQAGVAEAVVWLAVLSWAWVDATVVVVASVGAGEESGAT